jgi:hypothetical protein
MSDRLGPVEVEFTIPDSFGREADAAVKSMSRLTTAATKMPQEAKAAVLEQQNIVKSIEADIKQLEKSLKTISPGKARQEIVQELSAAKRALEEEKVGLTQLEGAADKAAAGNKRLSFQLRDMQEQLIRMRQAGQQSTDEYRKMELAAAALADEIADVKQVTRQLANDQATFQGFAQGITGLTGAFSAAGGAVALFAGENANLQKIQTKVQGLMAITIGLQQVSTTLNKDSAFMTVTVARAKQLWAAAEGKLTLALWGSNAAAKALMATMTLGVAIAIPALIALYNRLVDRQEAAVKAQKEAKRITTESNIEAGKARIEIDQMIRKLENFRGSKEAEKKLLGEVNKAYGDTFGTYKTLAQWLDVLKEKAAQYVQVMFLQSKATRLVDKAIKFDTQAQELAAQPLTDFVDMNDVQQATNMFGKVDEVKLKQIAEERKNLQLSNANSRKELALKEAELIQTQLQELQNTAGINVNFDSDQKETEKQTYSQKLAEVKKFFELYKNAIEMGQKEAAAIFQKQLPKAASYEEYITQELAKANKAGDLEKVSVLIPEKNEVSSGFKDLLKQYQSFSDQRAAIEEKYNADIEKLTKAGFVEKAQIAAEARDMELKALDEEQPLSKLLEKYRDYRAKIQKITIDSQKEIDTLRAAGYESEAKEAELKRDQDISKLIIENEFNQYERISEMGRKELREFIEKVGTKIQLMKAEGKNVEALEEVYNKAQKALTGADNSGDSFRTVAFLLNNMSSAAGQVNNELGRMVNLAGNLAGGFGDALDGLKAGGKDAIASFGSIVSIMATIADELDKQFGRQKRIADIEQERQQYNDRLRNLIDNTTEALERQIKALNKLNTDGKPEAYLKTLEMIEASIQVTRTQLEGMQFEFLPGPDELNQSINLDLLRSVTNAASDAEAIRIAMAEGWISSDQAAIALEYLATLEQLGDQADELSNERIEFLVQTNAINLSNELADTIVNAFNEGESAAMAWGKVTDQVMANAIKNALKMKLLSEPISQAVADLADDMVNGELSPAQQAEFRAKIDAAAQNFNNALTLYPDLFGPDADANFDQPDRNMFSSMTQQTGSELLGQFTALRMSAAAINDLLQEERQSRTSMRLALEGILENTSYCRKLADIDTTLKSIETDGVKIR